MQWRASWTLCLVDHHASGQGVFFGTTTSQDSQIVLGRLRPGVAKSSESRMPQKERKKLQEDDLVAWRPVFLFLVASYVKKAKGIPEKVQFTFEQPSPPEAVQARGGILVGHVALAEVEERIRLQRNSGEAPRIWRSSREANDVWRESHPSA